MGGGRAATLGGNQRLSAETSITSRELQKMSKATGKLETCLASLFGPCEKV